MESGMEKASRKGSSALIYRPLCRVPIPCERTAYGALFRQYAVGTPIESELHQLQKHAGFCAYLARKRERRFLRGEIRRICQQKTNFRLVLEETPIDRMPWRQRKARHA